ncbi:hypothetical protein F4819DRAFT_249481 [Hypoxylon fuscum]|nr:hypothetical protein F4819DRAFT_249481 [Hypoxylon fuscum]
MAYLELFVVPWGLYPRRILIYLHEKGLHASPLIKITSVSISSSLEMTAPGKPEGTVPILVLPDGSSIKQSIAILEYLEDICSNPQSDWQEEIAAIANWSMVGEDSQERAITREILALADEVTILFELACRKGSNILTSIAIEPSSATAASMSMDLVKRKLKLIEPFYADLNIVQSYHPGWIETDFPVTIADCVLFSLLQFSKELYGRHLVEEEAGLPYLIAFYDSFKERDSAKIPGGFYPKEIKDLACVWLEQ